MRVILSNDLKVLISNTYSEGRITLLKPTKTDRGIYIAIDIETFTYQGNQVPYAISYKTYKTIKYWHIFNYFNSNNDNTIDNDVIKLSDNMMSDCIDSLINFKKGKIKYIYAHNLGSFDGYFILKSLIQRSDMIASIKPIIDDSNSIIEIRFGDLIFRDSYRLFPASLKKLGVIVKSSYNKLDFDHTVTIDHLTNSDFHMISVKYIVNDVDLLYDIIKKFQKSILKDHGVALKKLYSISNMAFNIFRTHYLHRPLHATNHSEHKFLKPAFFGGAVQIYKNYGENLYYYDVNSLYPYAMMNKMPIRYLKLHNRPGSRNIINDDLFGFVDCIIIIPEDTKRPQVPVRQDGKLIYPTGVIRGRYFTEEVKAWIRIGYEVIIDKYHEYSYQENIFDDYVKHFYALKADRSLEYMRFINKLLLNGLYGYFGRKSKYELMDLVQDNNIINDITKNRVISHRLMDDIDYTHIDVFVENILDIPLSWCCLIWLVWWKGVEGK